jgi:hypothetical protein
VRASSNDSDREINFSLSIDGILLNKKALLIISYTVSKA